MIVETFGMAIIFSIIALSRHNAGSALGVLILSMLVWPEYLRVPLGLFQLSVPRIIALFLLIKYISKGRHRNIKYGRTDNLVIFIWLWTIIAAIIADSEFTHVSGMIGRVFDTVLMYFIARMSMLNSSDVKNLVRWLGLTALIMCIAGVYEMITWSSPYHLAYGELNALNRIEGYHQVRHGLLRAQGSTEVSIFFGMAMMLVTGLLWSIRGYTLKPKSFKLFIFSAVLATMTSLSSGPWIALFTLIGVNLYYRKTSLIKPTLLVILFLSLMLEAASNRHFYNLIDYIALDPLTAWYRTRLMEIAINQLPEYWLFGTGSNWPHHWATMLDGRNHIDVVNHFIIVALYGGLPALLMYIATHVIAIKHSIRKFRQDISLPRKKLIFSLAATLVALDLSCMSVGLYGPALLLSHILLGLIISITTSWSTQK